MEFYIPGRKAPVIYESCLSSTNTVLKKLGQEGAKSGTVLVAGRQSGGRGRLGRDFQSPPEGLYLSMLLRPDCSGEQCLSITPLAAVAACRAISLCSAARPGIKWPNDLVLGGKKLCGILTEMSMDEQGRPELVLGIGINVNNGSFPYELGGSACSLYSETGELTDKEQLGKELIFALDELYARWLEDERSILPQYRSLCISCGRDVLVSQNGASREGRALEVGEDFSLLVEFIDGTRENIRFGEVSVRGLEGYV